MAGAKGCFSHIGGCVIFKNDGCRGEGAFEYLAHEYPVVYAGIGMDGGQYVAQFYDSVRCKTDIAIFDYGFDRVFRSLDGVAWLLDLDK